MMMVIQLGHLLPFKHKILLIVCITLCPHPNKSEQDLMLLVQTSPKVTRLHTVGIEHQSPSTTTLGVKFKTCFK